MKLAVQPTRLGKPIKLKFLTHGELFFFNGRVFIHIGMRRIETWREQNGELKYKFVRSVYCLTDNRYGYYDQETIVQRVLDAEIVEKNEHHKRT